VLNPAEETSAADIKTFDRNARALQPPSQNAFPWVRITVKMHALAHHTPVFLRRFGSLGVYGDQALVSIPLRGSFDPLRINWSSYEAPQKRTFQTSVLFFFDTGERSVPVLPVGLFKGT